MVVQPLISLLPAFAFGLLSQDFQQFADIKTSIDAFEAKLPKPFAEKKVCYQDIGCFWSDQGPLKHMDTLPTAVDKIETKFYAFTQHAQTTAQEVNPYDTKTLGLVPNGQPVVIIIHGWGNSLKTEQLLSVKDSLIKYANITVIVTDWSKGAKQPEYVQSSRNTELVGHQVAFLVDTLRAKHNIDPKKVHLVGFSLGAQVAGFAGKFSQSAFKWQFGRITALDAAAPLFENYPGSYLTKEDALFVDAIHTSAGHDLLKGEIGFVKPLGHVDFYPHNGTSQPRCTDLLQVSCNHYSSVLYFEASLSGKCKFTAYSCDNWEDFLAKKCDKNGDSQLGYYSDKDPGRGVHYLTVSDKYPFCLN